MPTEQLPSQGELEKALRDSPRYFFEVIDEYYRRILMQYIKKHSWGVLDTHELLDAYQEVMTALWERIQKSDFDPDRPMRIVYRIARNIAVSMRRRKMRCPVNINQDAVVNAIASDLVNTTTGLEWRLLSPEERREFQQAVEEIIGKLPPRQRLAAQAFAETYEELREKDMYRPLAAAMSAISGKMEDVATAKSAWRFAREKIQEELARRGFGFMKGSANDESQWR